ncbi:MAG: hypothetical protein JWO09_199 [Bacteroidetes bacterium]|nr:hypothetical protein [Bacteroidota bacterium]
MKKINPCRLIFKGSLLAFFFLFTQAFHAGAQTFYTETFDGSPCPGSSNCDPSLVSWTTTSVTAEGAAANKWFVSCQENGNAAGTCGTGCAGDQSLHLGTLSNFFCSSGDCGAAYNATGAANVTDKRAESPVINCTGQFGITIAFNYIGKGQTCTTDFCDLQYSTNGGATWNNLQTCMTSTTCGSGQGRWTAFSIAMPATCDNNPNVKIGFHWKNNGDGAGSDPSFAVDDITLSVVTSTNTITTGVIAGSPFCACSAINVPFVSTGTFTAGNIYTAQLSDAAGSFAAPTAIGTLASTANAGTIAAAIPCGTPTGSGYRIRVVSSAPVVTGTDNGVNITINALPVATFSYTGTPYCSTAANPLPTYSGGGTAGTFTAPAGLVFVSAATGEVNLSASTAGTYTVTNTIPASGGCAAVTATSSITITTAPAGTFSYAATPYCADAADPSPTFSGGGVAGAFTAPAGLVFVSAAAGQVDLSASTPGTYTVTNTIAASGGCAAVTATSSITINPVQNAAFSYSASTYCQSGTDPAPTITGTPGGTFSASPAGLVFISTATGEIDLSASALNTYTITYTTPGPCSASSTASVTISTAPAATFSYTGSPYCVNGTDPFPTFGAGASAGAFSGPPGVLFVSTSTGQIDLSLSTPGTYVISNNIAASGGCPASFAIDTIVISPVQDSSFSYSSSTYCQSPVDPTPVITGTPGGTFTATPAGVAFISTTTGEIDISATPVNTYTITYTTPGPCPVSMSVSLTVTPPQIAGFSYAGSPYCANGADPSPTLAAGGSAGTFTASPAGLTFVSTATGEVDLSASTPGTYMVTNTIAASGSCPAASDSSSITINPVQDSTFSYPGSSFCQTGTTTPTVTGVAGGTFSSSPAGLVFVSTATGEIDLASSAIGSYSVTYTTPGPCAGSMTVAITITPPPTADFSYSSPSYCQNDPNPSPVFSGSSTAGTFTASPAGLAFVSPTTGQVNLGGSTAGTYTVTNTIAAAGGCPSATETTTITIDPVPTITVNSPVICNGESATLTASGASSYSWSSGGTASTETVSPTSSTTYTVTGTTGGCSNTALSIVSVSNCNVPDANFSGTPTVMCQAGCADFTDLSTNTPTSWNWSFPGATPSTSTAQNPTNICYSANGSYDVTLIATNSSGSDTLTISGYITVGAPVTVNITGNLLITSCEETVLTAVPGDGTYSWGPSGTLSGTSGASVTARPPATQQYYVTYTSPEGCTDSDTTTVVVQDINTYFLPTGFTPNNDGINDQVHLHGRGIDYFTLKIFDRIGEKVFESSDLEKGWDGRLHGLPMNDGVFVYTLDITFCNGERVKKHGDITLVK